MTHTPHSLTVSLNYTKQPGKYAGYEKRNGNIYFLYLVTLEISCTLGYRGYVISLEQVHFS